MKHRLVKLQRGGLTNQQYFGTWGNRGKGNEIQSAIENGLSGLWNGLKWVGEKVWNADDYIEQGLAYAIGSIPGGEYSRDEIVQDVKNKQQAKDAGEPGYINLSGEYEFFPITGMPPALPGLPKNPSKEVVDAYNGLKKLRTTYAIRESQLRKINKLDDMPNTLTAKRYKEQENYYYKLINAKPAKTETTPVLSKRQKAEFKHTKGMATGDGRANNPGRPALREAQYDYFENMMRNDKNPAVQKIIRQYDLKKAKGMDPIILRARRKEMIYNYAKTHGYTWFTSLFE